MKQCNKQFKEYAQSMYTTKPLARIRPEVNRLMVRMGE